MGPKCLRAMWCVALVPMPDLSIRVLLEMYVSGLERQKVGVLVQCAAPTIPISEHAKPDLLEHEPGSHKQQTSRF